MKVNSDAGFTLLELIFTLAIVITVTMLSCNSFSTLVSSYQQRSIVARLFHTLAYARSEAIKRNQIIALCGSRDTEHCDKEWSYGYLVFIPATKTILRSEKWTFPRIHSKGLLRIKYNGSGQCLTRGTIYIESPTQPPAKIVIYDSGRARLE